MRLTIILSVFWVAIIIPATTALADVETIEASISAVDAKVGVQGPLLPLRPESSRTLA